MVHSVVYIRLVRFHGYSKKEISAGCTSQMNTSMAEKQIAKAESQKNAPTVGIPYNSRSKHDRIFTINRSPTHADRETKAILYRLPDQRVPRKVVQQEMGIVTQVHHVQGVPIQLSGREQNIFSERRVPISRFSMERFPRLDAA